LGKVPAFWNVAVRTESKRVLAFHKITPHEKMMQLANSMEVNAGTRKTVFHLNARASTTGKRAVH
jgi:hypothetical protein